MTASVISRERGFTLLETLVALTILALSIPVLFGIFAGGMERTREDRQAMHARVLAQSLLAAASASPRDKIRKGVDAAGFGWSLETARDGQETSLSAETMTATVSWISGGERRSLRLATSMLAAPEPPP